MYQRILVPLDGSEVSNRGLHEALRLVQDTSASLVLLHVIDNYPTMREFASSRPLEDMRKHRLREGCALLAPPSKLARDAGAPVQDVACFATESASASILECAVQNHCDLIVMSSHGRSGVRRALLGSVAEAVSRHSTVPVLIVPAPVERAQSPVGGTAPMATTPG